ncbi:MAG: transcriptional activator NhaR [Verrucomicrobia bacterium]|nr:transcriptional activator NhaR [Verrucomicrobiota bacterium]
MEFLNYHHLRYFWAVAKEGGLTKAAAKLNVTQPTICAQIQALEGALEEKLFRRRGRRLELTEAGQQVFSYAEEIFSLGSDLLSTLQARPTTRPLRIQIGIVDSLPKLVSYEIIKPVFQLPHPVQVACYEAKTIDLLAQLAAYRLDIVLADEPSPSSVNLKVFNHLLGECGLSFCAAPKLAARLKSRFPQSLHEAPALLPTADTALRRSLEKWFEERRIRPRVVAEFDDAALMKVAATDALGFCPLPRIVVDEAVSHYGVQVIGHTEECREQFYAISAERKLNHPAVLAITSAAQTTLFGGASSRKRQKRASTQPV